MTEGKLIKVAVITDDGTTISEHFGRAGQYLVATVEKGKIIQRELRSKLGHSNFTDQPHTEEHHGPGHGLDSASHGKHLQMSDAIFDCEALLCRGMGMGAYESIKMRGIRPVLTDIAYIDDAVLAYIEGRIVDHVDRLH